MQYRFGDYALDTHRCEVCRMGTRIKLRPKVFDVLRYLIAHRDRVIAQQELLEHLWPDQFVGDATLKSCIKEARRAVGDTGQAQRLIQTLHGRGYRFIAPVRTLLAPGGPETEAAAGRGPAARFRRPPHFVGRAAALAQLTQWWTTACQGTRQVGVIAGEPGIGKTALGHTFVAQVLAAEDVWVGHGQCLDHYGAGEAYLPLLEALGRLGRGPEGERLVTVLRQYAPSWLVQMPGLVPPHAWESLQRTAGEATQPRMLRELTEALDVLTIERPLVLVLEDLHWSDASTLAWLAYVARRPDAAHLLLLGTYRPVDAMVQAHPLRAVLTELQQHGQCVELALDSLSEGEVTAYLRQRFGDTGLAADLAHVLHQRTRGNPLFLIAVVDELVRQQVVREGPAGWTRQRGVETIPMLVPATLRSLIELQLAHCSREAQTLLAAASVAGVEFAAAAVAAGLERADDAIEAQCATLAHQGQFLQARGRTEWPDGTVTACFGFHHALYHDIVYQRIPAGRQTRWHARIGARLAQGFGAQAGDMAAALAMHCVRGRLLPQAVQYAQQAGQIAARRAAYQEAVTYYEQALHALEQLPPTPDRLAQAIDLRLAMQDVLFPLGMHDRIIDTLREAERLAEALGDHRRLGWGIAELSGSYRQIHAYDQAVAVAQRAVTLAVTTADDDLHAWALLRLGQAAYFQGDYHRASEGFREAIAFSAASAGNTGESTFLPAHARSWLVYCLTQRGEFDEGLALGTEAVRLAEGGNFPTSRCAAYASCGYLSLLRGDCARAMTFLERGLDLCRRWHSLDWFPECATSLGLVYALAGRVADADPLLEQAVAQEATMAGGYKAIWLIKLGQGSLLVGRLTEARAQAERALRLSHERRERGFQAWALWLRGDIAAQGAPPEAAQAEAFYQQALTLAEARGMRPLQAHCHRGLGTRYAATGPREQARAALATAMEMYRTMEMTFWLPETEAVLAQVGGQ